MTKKDLLRNMIMYIINIMIVIFVLIIKYLTTNKNVYKKYKLIPC
jgi:hypothetical protein